MTSKRCVLEDARVIKVKVLAAVERDTDREKQRSDRARKIGAAGDAFDNERIAKMYAFLIQYGRMYGELMGLSY